VPFIGAGELCMSFNFFILCFANLRRSTVPNSVLDAIKMGIWDFEPEDMETSTYTATGALPGTDEKLDILAKRVKGGLPLWHPEDRRTYDDTETG